jgi:hypothetical protein
MHAGFDQTKEGLMLREINKAYAGFYVHEETERECITLKVETGNWGCGMDPEPLILVYLGIARHDIHGDLFFSSSFFSLS